MTAVTAILPKPIKIILFPFYRIVMLIKDVVVLGLSLILYLVCNYRSQSSYQAMIRLFCATRGLSNDLISWFPKVFYPPYKLDYPIVGFAGSISKEQSRSIKKKIEADGYYIFDKTLDSNTIAEVLEFTKSFPCRPRKSDADKPDAPELGAEVIFDRANPKAARYEYDPNQLINTPVFQKILNDKTILEIAQQYLGCKPTIDIINLWWHTSAMPEPDAIAAQYYHFDMDRPKWIKFFINFTEVKTESGPHCFIKGSHRSFGIPWKFLKRGYVRICDREIYDHYGKSKEIEFCAPAGTILAEDTRGFHKGKHCTKGDRLLLGIQFTNYLFGTDPLKMKIEKSKLPPDLSVSMDQHKRVFSLMN